MLFPGFLGITTNLDWYVALTCYHLHSGIKAYRCDSHSRYGGSNCGDAGKNVEAAKYDNCFDQNVE